MTNRHITLAIVVLMLAFSNISQAALHDRGAGMIYDDMLDVTWLQDANYAATSGYDADGFMFWQDAVDWAANLEFSGYDDWRLPTVSPKSGSTELDLNFSFDGTTDYAWNITNKRSELAYMFHVNLDLPGRYATDGRGNPNWSNKVGVADIGFFTNVRWERYWYGTTSDARGNGAMIFLMDDGYQFPLLKTVGAYAWAVRNGDVAVTAVPEPEVYAMFLIGLGLISTVARRNNKKVGR